MLRVLVTACLGPSGESVARLLRDEPGVQVISVDAAEGNIPMGTAPDYCQQLEACGRRIWPEGPDLIIPGSDEEALALAEDPRSSTRPLEGIQWTRDKAALYLHLNNRVPVPQYLVGPFIKRRTGRGGAGAYRIDEDQIACEYLPGDEYSVDLLRWKGAIHACVVRRRIQVIRGACLVGEVVENERIVEYATTVARILRLEGPLCIQFKRDVYGTPVLTDVNPRCGGGVSISAAAGVNIPSLLVRCWRGENVPEIYPKPGVYSSLITRTP